MLTRLVSWLRGRNVFVVLVIALLAGFSGGTAMWGGFNYVAAATSSNAFCTSCHEMQENAAEYHRSVHYTNVYGVRAQCADCHVPKPFFKRVVHMIGALRDVTGHISGVIETPAKFKAHRLEMAKRVWAEMEADNSIGCRSCHSFEAMDFDKQPKAASMAMHPAMKSGQTCISCHKGIVHDLPGASAEGASLASLFPPETASGAAGAITVATTPFYLSAADSADGAGEAGTLWPATGVSVIGHSDSATQVTLKGWRDKADDKLDAVAGQPIVQAVLEPQASKALKRDPAAPAMSGGETRTSVTLTAWVPDKALSYDPQKVWSGAVTLFKSTCGGCHALPAPDSLTAGQWVGMAEAMRPKTTLTEDQYRLVLKYLQTRAKGAGETNG